MADKLPFVLAHVRLTCVGVDVEALEAIQEGFRAVLETQAEVYGFRIKRRVLTATKFAEVFKHYEKRHQITLQRKLPRRRATYQGSGGPG